MRRVTHQYADPLDQIWLTTAGRIGLRVERSGEVYAATDGRHTLAIGEAGTLDADDSLAQMILHELCHSMVEGPDAFTRPDWGLDNTGPRDVLREHACLRLQAQLAGRFGLREFLAPTTEYRAFWDTLGADPFEPRRAPDTVAAILGAQRSERAPWAPHLGAALAATAEVVHRAAAFAEPASPSLYAAVAAAPAVHPTGRMPPSPVAGEVRRCGECAWRDEAGACRQAEAAVDAGWIACARFEPALDCCECGACCREAYHSVTVEADDPVRGVHPELLVDRGSYVEIRRSGDRCAALDGGRSPDERYACRIYAARPVPCREFELGSDNCLIARRRVGLSL
ncbi:MAG TPA: YkgJ family cysteine cluster protein [Kofleriaceae bacterium]|nr:YkgJ family cysteine cluster protein [Kofleriaceae bacterium]